MTTTAHERYALEKIMELLHEMRQEISRDDIRVIFGTCLQALLDDAETVDEIAKTIGNKLCNVHPDSPPSTQVSLKPGQFGNNGWIDASNTVIATLKRMGGV